MSFEVEYVSFKVVGVVDCSLIEEEHRHRLARNVSAVCLQSRLPAAGVKTQKDGRLAVGDRVSCDFSQMQVAGGLHYFEGSMMGVGVNPEKKALELCCVKVQKQTSMKITWSLLSYGSSS